MTPLPSTLSNVDVPIVHSPRFREHGHRSLDSASAAQLTGDDVEARMSHATTSKGLKSVKLLVIIPVTIVALAAALFAGTGKSSNKPKNAKKPNPAKKVSNNAKGTHSSRSVIVRWKPLYPITKKHKEQPELTPRMTKKQRDFAIKQAKELDRFWNSKSETKADFDRWYDAIDAAGDRDGDDEPAFVARVHFSDAISQPVLGSTFDRRAFEGKWKGTEHFATKLAPNDRFARVTFGEKPTKLEVVLKLDTDKREWSVIETKYAGSRVR